METMNAVDFFLGRYREFHRGIFDDLTKELTEAQIRGRPRPGMNPIAWLLWHAARIEDVGVNRFITDGRQVLDSGAWLGRMKTARRDVGTGMVDGEVDELCAQIDLEGLRGYWDAVQAATLAIAETLRNENLDTVVAAERIHATATKEGAVAPVAPWLTEFWAKGRTRGWYLSQLPFLHVYGHYFEALVVKGQWGHPSR
jgi:DinB family protein